MKNCVNSDLLIAGWRAMPVCDALIGPSGLICRHVSRFAALALVTTRCQTSSLATFPSITASRHPPSFLPVPFPPLPCKKSTGARRRLSKVPLK